MKTLYICYFGLREPLVQTQVIPYLRQLSRAGIEVELLTFEPDMKNRWTASERESSRRLLSADGIEWRAMEYHKRPPLLGTLRDIFIGAVVLTRLARRKKIDVLHARSHMPLAMALLVKRLTGVRVIFDIRGLMAEEYVDAGIWKAGSMVFRGVKWLEAIGLRGADQFVVLTNKMRDWLIEHKEIPPEKIEVIPCCVDFSKYDAGRDETRPEEREKFEVIYSGSVTGLYLLEEMGEFFLALRKLQPDAFLRILTTSSSAAAAARLRQVGLSESDFWVGPVAPAEVPQYLSRARLGLSFRKATFSQMAASPTKIPEYLAAGLPVVCNAGIGDVDDLVTGERIGVIVENLTAPDYTKAASDVVELFKEADLSSRCYAAARTYFDIEEVGGKRYFNVYRKLSGEEGGRKNKINKI